jgi:hypothetical protein
MRRRIEARGREMKEMCSCLRNGVGNGVMSAASQSGKHNGRAERRKKRKENVYNGDNVSMASMKMKMIMKYQ